MKTCSKCLKLKKKSAFSNAPARQGGLQAWCKDCMAEHQKIYRPAYYQANREACDRNAKTCVKRLRDAVIEMYGNACSCCGQTRKNFLSLEHIQGGGNAHRKSMSRYTLWKQILDAGPQPEIYTVLCYNCNMSRGFYGFCCNDPLETDFIQS